MGVKQSQLPHISLDILYGTTGSHTFSATDTWETIDDVNIVESDSTHFPAQDFTFASGVITYTGSIPLVFQFSGNAGFSSTSAATITFAGFKNGTEILSQVHSVETLASADKKGGFSECAPVYMEQGDTIEIKAQTTVLCTLTLQVFGVRLCY